MESGGEKSIKKAGRSPLKTLEQDQLFYSFDVEGDVHFGVDEFIAE